MNLEPFALGYNYYFSNPLLDKLFTLMLTHSFRLKELATTKLRELNNQKEEFDSVYFHPDSLESATVAAGCVLQVNTSLVAEKRLEPITFET